MSYIKANMRELEGTKKKSKVLRNGIKIREGFMEENTGISVR